MKPSNLTIKDIITETNKKDIEKGQKILAAMYMVTNHLSDSDAIRLRLRDLCCTLVSQPLERGKDALLQIQILLGSAVFAGNISEKNSSVIIYQATHFLREQMEEQGYSSLENIFNSEKQDLGRIRHSIKDNKKTLESSIVLSSNRPMPAMSNIISINNKSLRQEKILSFINDRKSAVIKDIVLLFPDVSEKTIQRELNALIDSGRITKRGSKRWSIYMAVNSLL